VARKRQRSEPSGNRLLDSLHDGQELVAQMERVSLDLRDVLYEAHEPIRNVFFPIHGVSSIVSDLGEGRIVEIATVGSEGMVGVPLFLGVDSMNGRAFQQIAGEAYRLDAASFLVALSSVVGLRDILNRYTYALLAQVAQSVSCNRLHTPEQRCARWLLMTHDRVLTDDFELTQEFLAQMLAVRRATVSEVAQVLQESGLIRYRRGRISVVDRTGLERTACECYRIVEAEFDRVLG
jgi:CRP-like cAMP-binding protein